MDHQCSENGARNIYSNYNQMRADVECSPDQSQKLYLYIFIYNYFRMLAVSVSEFCQSSITVHLYQPTLLRWLSLLCTNGQLFR